jgi:tripartite-type tricarboxylate transporter receptor subunit TctC
MKLKLVVLLWGICLVMTAGGQARGEPYPTRFVRIIVPAAAGSALDVNARKVADKLSQSLGQTVIVENKPGANGIIGTDLAAKAKPDGYTLLMGSSSTLTINPSLYPSLPYRPLDDFAAITLAVRGTPIMLVSASSQVQTLAEFIKLAKAKPGQMHYGSPGTGSIQHLAGKLLERKAGIELVHVPYKNQSEIVSDLISGRIEAMIEFGAVAVPLIKVGKLRALAIAGPARKPDLPEVPTAAQAGTPGFEVTGWAGYLAPAGTPPEIIEKLNREITVAISGADYSNWVTSLGSEVIGGLPQAFAKIIRADLASWDALIREAGVSME